MNNFSELFEASAYDRNLREGTDILAHVIDINDNFVIVNAGLKSEGRIPLSEFTNDGGELEVNIGDTVEVEIELLENGMGEAILSRHSTRRKQVWQKIEEAVRDDTPIEGVIQSRVKGGFAVSLDGLRAFLPGSLVDVFPLNDASQLMGTVQQFKPIKINRHRNSVVVSRRAVIERNMLGGKGGAAAAEFEEGAVVKGTVRAIVDYGAFVEVSSGIFGLLHITDLSWKHTPSIADVLTSGDEIEVKILRIDREKGRISLGVKQLQADPWADFDRTYPVGSRVFGKVTRVLEYGAFVEVGDGVQGLVHSSEMLWTRKNIPPSKIWNVGDEVEVMVLEIDKARRRISLGSKQCRPNPWQEFATAYRKGDLIRGAVRSINEFGLFVELPGEIDGLVRIADLSYSESPEEAIRNYKKGQAMEAMVLSIDVDRERIGLGVKQMTDSVFESFVGENLKGALVKGRIVEIGEKGAFAELASEVRGFMPIREVAEEHVDNIGDYVRVGEDHEFVLMDSDRRNRKIILSLKEKTRAAREKDTQRRKEQTPTLGAMLHAKLREVTGRRPAENETAAETSVETSAAETAVETVTETSAVETVVETAAETSVETSAVETSSETVAETSAVETAVETVTETSAVETAVETVTETSAVETVAETSSEIPVETAVETSSETVAETSVAEGEKRGD